MEWWSNQDPRKPIKLPIPVEIKFGEAPTGIECSNCRRIDNRGFWVISGGTKAVLVCIRCTTTAIVKYQETNPSQKLFDHDVDVDDEAYSQAAQRVKVLMPEIGESKALEVAKTVIEGL